MENRIRNLEGAAKATLVEVTALNLVVQALIASHPNKTAGLEALDRAATDREQRNLDVMFEIGAAPDDAQDLNLRVAQTLAGWRTLLST